MHGTHDAGGDTPRTFTVTSIGVIRNERTEPIDDNWDLVNSTIVLDLRVVGADATRGLGEFSHVEVVFLADRVDPATVANSPSTRHPRGHLGWPEVGVLAQRHRERINRLGVTVCELMAVRPGGVIEVRGLDAIDGTPVLDLKPHYAEYAPRGDVLQPDWSHELMRHYWVTSDASPSTSRSPSSDTHDGPAPVSVSVSAPAPAPIAAEPAVPCDHPRLDPDAWLAEVLDSPADRGTLQLIVRRPSTDDRETLDQAELALDVGLVGDNWLARGSRSRPDGTADPDAQLNIMNWRCASLVAGSPDRVPLAGDQLFVDLDLSDGNLPPGTRLAIGTAVIEVTAKPHTGCAKFTRRFGLAAHRWVNGRAGKQHRLRGICAKVVVPGTIHRGDTVTKVLPDGQ
jgi:tRNA (Thr-GGU) A37 N-methylase